jgi:hypothetical protein
MVSSAVLLPGLLAGWASAGRRDIVKLIEEWETNVAKAA